MATLAGVRATVFPAATSARPLDEQTGALEVGWVRVLKARVPAFDALEAGDLAIVSDSALAVVAPDETSAADLAGALAGAGVRAVLLCGGGSPPGDLSEQGRPAPGPRRAARPAPSPRPAGSATAALDRLAGATDRAGICTFRLGPADPAAVERSVIAYLVNQRAEVERRAAELDAQLTRIALAGHGLGVMAAAIGAFLGRAVAIEGPSGETLAVHAPEEPPSAAAAAARYLSRTLGSAAALRIVIPPSPGERGFGGRLLLLGEPPVHELDRMAGARAAALLALELARAAAVDQARDELRRGEPLPADGPPWVAIVARQVLDAGSPAPADGDGAAGLARERLRAGLRSLAPARRLLLRGSPESLELRLVAAAGPDDPAGAELAARVAAYLGRTVAVSAPFTQAAGRPAAEAAARGTLEAAMALQAPPRVAHVARLPAYQLLGNLHNVPDGPRQARLLLAPLLDRPPATRAALLATLRVILEQHGSGEAAAILGVHRNTVAYRIGVIERATSWDLRDPDLGLALLVALRIVQSD